MITLKDLKLKSVNTLLNKNTEDIVHSKQVTSLALEIFDVTKGILHNYGHIEREYLEFGALLHDIGYIIASSKHNKHSFDIIIRSHMEGFTEQELVFIGNIARYHRGSIPKDKHKCYSQIVNKSEKYMVNVLSAFLRIADGLDRSHTSNINSFDCVIDKLSQTCTFILHPRTHYCSVELYGANKKKELFENLFNLTVRFKVQVL